MRREAKLTFEIRTVRRKQSHGLERIHHLGKKHSRSLSSVQPCCPRAGSLIRPCTSSWPSVVSLKCFFTIWLNLFTFS